MVTHACNPSTWKAELGRSAVQKQPDFLKNKQTKNNRKNEKKVYSAH